MGGMAVLEWALCTSPGYVRNLIPIATATSHTAWGIAWAETQRQCITNDVRFNKGTYDAQPAGQPAEGLAAARMIAMLTYRSSMSFEARFGRRLDQSLARRVSNGTKRLSSRRITPDFAAQGYLHYQGDKFVHRFDANCYLHLLDKINSHDVSRGRADGESRDDLQKIFERVPPGSLVIGVDSDILFPPAEQEKLSDVLPDATLKILLSTNGHDGFLLEMDEVNRLICEHLKLRLPEIYDGPPLRVVEGNDFADMKHKSTVGED